MKVGFTPLALRDLEEIMHFIADDNPERAVTFVGELEDACLTLADKPLRFPPAGLQRDAALRVRAYGNYRIFYRVRDAIEIIRIASSARDLAKLFPED